MPVPKDKLRLGGMALRNGLLVHGPTHWAAAVRTKTGDVKVASGPKPRVTFADEIPGLRGLVRLPINDDEIVDRALSVQIISGKDLTFLTYDTNQAMRARHATGGKSKVYKTPAFKQSVNSLWSAINRIAANPRKKSAGHHHKRKLSASMKLKMAEAALRRSAKALEKARGRVKTSAARAKAKTEAAR